MKNIDKVKKSALKLMKSAGFPIKNEVMIEVDEKLPFMGYTTQRDGKTLIVVSGWSLKSEMTMGLIVHELSHVYRIQTNHPSHNSTLHDKVLRKVSLNQRIYPYQWEVIHNVINNIQDLYADDISFPVYIKKAQKENLNEFFLGWIHPPLESVTTTKDKWRSAETLLSTAFARANLERHHVPDTGNKIKIATGKFLSGISKKHAQKYDFFKNAMVGFPEKVTDTKFENLLTEYLIEFWNLTKL